MQIASGATTLALQSTALGQQDLACWLYRAKRRSEDCYRTSVAVINKKQCEYAHVTRLGVWPPRTVRTLDDGLRGVRPASRHLRDSLSTSTRALAAGMQAHYTLQN